MIAYAIVVTKGNIHEPFMEIRVGDSRVLVRNKFIREFVQTANKTSLSEVLKGVNPEGRDLITALYEKFKDEI